MPAPDSNAPLPVVLTIAGSDCSSGAGLQADLKTFSTHGTYGLTVVTCIVSEIPGKVSQIQAATPEIVGDQLRILLGGFPIAALKTGMLFSKEIITEVAAILSALPPEKRPKLVIDPVMIATSGDPLLQSDAVEAYETLLFPLADVITPNMDEAAALLGNKISSVAELAPAAAALHAKYGCSVLLKGGHLCGSDAVDVLHTVAETYEFTAPFIPDVSTHGTGCTYAAAITARLAQGHPLPEAVRLAKNFVTSAIAQSFKWGSVHALNHFVQP